MSTKNNYQTVIEAVTDKMTRDTEDNVTKNYQQTLLAIKAQLVLVYEKYEKNGVLSYAEMTKYRRLEKLFQNIKREIYNLTSKNAAETKNLSSAIYQEAYYRTEYMIEQLSKVILKISPIKQDVIDASVQNPMSGLTLDETLQKNRDHIMWLVKQVIIQGLILGLSYKQMADKLKSVFGGDAAKALRVVQTEAHRNREAATRAAAKRAQEQGVSFTVSWVSVLDRRTRDQHSMMDGVQAKTKKDGTWFFTFPDGIKTEAPGLSGYAHHDVNCRCSTRYYPKEAGSNSAKKNKSGTENYSYEQWADERGI